MLESRSASADGTSAPEEPRRSNLLVVDDNEMARNILRSILESAGYDVTVVEEGGHALNILRRGGVDLVLLDVMMPGMDGFEICRRIRARPDTRGTPVIMVTALTEREQRIAGLDAGADDFVSKPIDRGELIARVRSHLRAKALMDELALRHAELERLQQSRELLVSMILHDLKGPLAAIEGCLHLLKVSGSKHLSDSEKRYIENGILGCQQAMELLFNVLDAVKIEKDGPKLRPELFDLAEFLADRTRIFETQAARRSVTAVCSIPPALRPFHVVADPGLITRVLSNLLANAIRHSLEGSRIEVTLAAVEGGAEIVVSDQGVGISAEDLGRLFQRFDEMSVRKRGGHQDSGLGLYFCRLATEAHGGRIWAESQLGKGSRFHVYLPKGRLPSIPRSSGSNRIPEGVGNASGTK